MAIYGAFSSSMLGMMSQSFALQNIGLNIANVNTGGYRHTETQFSTVLGNQLGNLQDLGGVRPTSSQRIDQQGIVTATGRNLDAAINGSGFFVLNTEINGTGQFFYSRDGSFEAVAGNNIQALADDGITTITTQETYLTDKNGYYVMGWTPQPDGSFNTNGAVGALRVDPYAFSSSGIQTTFANYVGNLPADDPSLSTHLYNTEVYDNNGNSRIVTMEFIKDPADTGATNTWSLTPQWRGPTVAQVDTVTLGGTIETGDVYRVTVGSTTVQYTVTGAETGIADVRNALVTLLNSDPVIGANVTAAASGTNQIRLTANTAGTAFTSLAQTLQGPASVAQVDTVTITNPVAAGEVFTVTLAGTPFTVTATGVDTAATIATKLALLIDADTAYAAADLGGGQLTITAATAGVPFTIASVTDSIGGTIGNTPTTPNYTAITDNTATAATTVANNDGNYSGTSSTITFNNDGTLASPSTINYSLNFGGGNTAAYQLDLSGITQYAGDFEPYSFWQNGYGKGQMREIQFNGSGHLVASFTNALSRSVYQLALASFSNPNGMEMLNGNLFREGVTSGTATLFAADESGQAYLSPASKELSNVDLAKEFTNMITTQQAYNSNATVFRTVDEMTTVARDLKR